MRKEEDYGKLCTAALSSTHGPRDLPRRRINKHGQFWTVEVVIKIDK